MTALDERSGEIFRRIVESYLGNGEPLGSRSLSRLLPMSLSPASVRNVMADLEEAGFVASPHTSAGRVPTPRGYRLFVDNLLTVRPLEVRQLGAMEEALQVNRQIGSFPAPRNCSPTSPTSPGSSWRRGARQVASGRSNFST